MAFLQVLQEERGLGFDFSNHRRNVQLLTLHHKNQERVDNGKIASTMQLGHPMPPLRKTGTTICGVVYSDGVVLGSDTRATEGPIVADPNCSKLHRISDCIYAAGAGTAADLDHMTEWLAIRVDLHQKYTGAKPRVAMAVNTMGQELFKYMGHKGCALVLGGVDIRGPSLYKIHPHGSTDICNFAAMGSGSLNAMAVLESGYKDQMTLEEAKALVCKAITAGIINDLGSGGNVDLCIITKDGAEHLRKFKSPANEAYKAKYASYAHGTTPFFKQHIQMIKQHIETTDTAQDVEMEEAA